MIHITKAGEGGRGGIVYVEEPDIPRFATNENQTKNIPTHYSPYR